MSRDTIVDEVRKAREEYALQFNYDLDAICADLQRREKLSDRPVVSLPKRPPILTPLGPSDARTESPAQR
jgi:hypothetical protein